MGVTLTGRLSSQSPYVFLPAAAISTTFGEQSAKAGIVDQRTSCRQQQEDMLLQTFLGPT